MSGMLKIALGAVAGAVAGKMLKGYITPSTGFLGAYNDTIVEAAITAAVAVAVSKVL